MTKHCYYCGKDVDIWDRNLLLIKIVDVQFREFEGVEESEGYMCIECLKGMLK